MRGTNPGETDRRRVGDSLVGEGLQWLVDEIGMAAVWAARSGLAHSSLPRL